MVLSEAGAAGMAIISTSVAGIPEIVRNGETGITVSAGDITSLTRALHDLATSPTLRMNLGERAIAHVTRHYDARTNANLVLDLLKAEADATRAERLAASKPRDCSLAHH
jgi:glycosyltransferase involved in cell wall biosynthesis